MFSKESVIGIAGSGAMGSGIAQVAASAGHKVLIYDNNAAALSRASANLKATLGKLSEKKKISPEQAAGIEKACSFVSDLKTLSGCDLIIEAIVENLEIKRSLFRELEGVVSGKCVLASNTSSLSITSIAAACKDPSRVIGMHFFNPAPLMPLAEIIPAISTSPSLAAECKTLSESWGKTAVIVKDTPGFIVNRVARPFYSEALRIYDEGLASMSGIDTAMKEGGFRMGPFELMDMIGHDVNYVVTETVWKELYFDPRFRPSLTQKRLLEAGFLGRKSGRGFFDYRDGAAPAHSGEDLLDHETIRTRILCMLINEAADSLYLKIASREDIDLAMTKGVNYPKGLLKWADDLGPALVVKTLDALREEYQEDRYRVCPLLRRMATQGKTFY
jgi:3-hydroxybutyryl-CoA dehydrogenase